MFDRLRKRIIKSRLAKMKTVWVGIAICIYGVVLSINGNTEEGGRAVLEGLALVFLRQGIEKQKQK